jgi:hypothetical protein
MTKAMLPLDKLCFDVTWMSIDFIWKHTWCVRINLVNPLRCMDLVRTTEIAISLERFCSGCVFWLTNLAVCALGSLAFCHLSWRFTSANFISLMRFWDLFPGGGTSGVTLPLNLELLESCTESLESRACAYCPCASGFALMHFPVRDDDFGHENLCYDVSSFTKLVCLFQTLSSAL